MATRDLLPKISEKYGTNLENTLLVGCQHFLEGNLELILHLFEQGLRPSDTYLIGKSYSFNEEIAQELESAGSSVHRYSFDSHRSYDVQFEEEIKRFVEALPQTNKRIICIDDGGHVLSNISKTRNCVGVEQTSSGYEKIKDSTSIPIVNVARSRAKLHYETPHIVECFLRNLETYLTAHKLKPEKALILGGGHVGKEVQKQISCPAYVFDTDQEKSELYLKELKNTLGEYDLIIGASGTTSITKKEHGQLREGTVLASVSSSDREFDAVHLRKMCSQNDNPHQDYQSNGIYLPNSGFPLTFTGGRTAVSTEHIRLTHALMLAGIYQALDEEVTGVVDLNPAIQETIIRGCLA